MLLCSDEDCICLHHQLIYCFENGYTEKAKLILAKLANIENLTDDSGSTLLHYSVKHRNGELTQYLINEGCDVDDQDNFGVTPLMLAVNANDGEAVEILLNNKANLYLTNSNGQSSLELAFNVRLDWLNYISFKNKLIIELISETLFDKLNDDFSKGMLTEFPSTANNSMKLAVVVLGNAKVAQFVLENGYPIDFREPKRQRTALHCAILLAKFENTQLLLEYGANVDVLDKSNCSPLIYYAWNFITSSTSEPLSPNEADLECLKFEEVDEESEVLKCLLSLSTSLYTPNFFGITDVEYLLYCGRIETVKTLLLNGVNVHEGDHLSLVLENKNVGISGYMAFLMSTSR